MSGDRTFGHTEIQRGRPKTSRLVAVTFKLEPELLRQVDEEASRRSIGRSDAIRGLLTRALDGAAARAVDGAATSESLSQVVHRAVVALNVEHKYGGVVPLPALRERLAVLAPEASRADVDAALIALERDWLIDLSVVQAPGQLDPSTRALGIARPGRGLVFYVMPR